MIFGDEDVTDLPPRQRNIAMVFQSSFLSGSPGQDALSGKRLEVLSWNRPDFIVERLSRGDVAAVVMEPAMCNTGAIHPQPGYLEAVRVACRRHGTVLVFDEVITGFRVGPGGVQGRLGVTPDLTVFGKAVASGFPVAGVAGAASLMDLFATGKVMHGGTYNSQSIGMAATVATLKALKAPRIYDHLAKQGTRLMRAVAHAFAETGVPAKVTGFSRNLSRRARPCRAAAQLPGHPRHPTAPAMCG